MPSGSSLKPAAKAAIRAVLSPMGIRLGTFRQHRPRPLNLPPSPRPAPGEDLPTISIATPSLNQGRFLEGAIRSVLDQGYPSVSMAVCDGGSTDETRDVLERFDGRLAAWRMEPDGGQAAAINKGFRLLAEHVSRDTDHDHDRDRTGDIMAWLNADDRLLPGSLLAVGRFFRGHPEIDVVYGYRLILDEQGRVVGRWVLPPHRDSAFRWRDYVPQETLFWRRAAWERAGGRIDETLDFAVDWDLLIRLQAAGARFARLPYCLGAFTTHEAQKSIAQRSKIGTPEFEAIQDRVASSFPARMVERTRSGMYMLEAAAWDWSGVLAGGPRLATGDPAMN